MKLTRNLLLDKTNIVNRWVESFESEYSTADVHIIFSYSILSIQLNKNCLNINFYLKSEKV